jgi:ATP phosphoribosyltransferase
MTRIRVAIQKSGRLSERSQALLQRCGLRFMRSKDKLFWYGQDFPVDLLLVRDDDIPRLLLDGVCELGIVGQNIAEEVMLERNGGSGLEQLRALDFGGCRLSLAVPEDSTAGSAKDLDGGRIATSYPALTRALLEREGVEATIVELSGSVEIAPGMGTADAISDLVSTAPPCAPTTCASCRCCSPARPRSTPPASRCRKTSRPCWTVSWLVSRACCRRPRAST